MTGTLVRFGLSAGNEAAMNAGSQLKGQTMFDARTLRIRELNDAFRQTLSGGMPCFTDGVHARGAGFSTIALSAVQRFDDFNADNDPYGEHDFGTVTIDGEKLFWKIDYYDRSVHYGSNDPADPAQTTRVLTIMLAEEY